MPFAVRATLALLLMGSAAYADTTVRDANGSTVVIDGYTTPAGKKVNSSAIYAVPVTNTNRSGTIATASTAQVLTPANAARKGGYCQADPQNNDNLSLSFGGTAGTSPSAANDCILTPGGTCPFTINGGVFQGAISGASATAGTAFHCTDFQ